MTDSFLLKNSDLLCGKTTYSNASNQYICVLTDKLKMLESAFCIHHLPDTTTVNYTPIVIDRYFCTYKYIIVSTHSECYYHTAYLILF